MIDVLDPQPVRLRFTVDDYYKMIELGMLEDYERAEIIGGELIKKMTIGDRHAAVVDFLNKFFIKNVSDDDLALADLRRFDGKRHPRPAEVILMVEVSDATLKYDRDKKLPLYAAAGIPEVWLVNLPNEIIEIHTAPAFGLYQSIKIFRRGEKLQSSALPGLNLPVDAVLD